MFKSKENEPYFIKYTKFYKICCLYFLLIMKGIRKMYCTNLCFLFSFFSAHANRYLEYDDNEKEGLHKLFTREWRLSTNVWKMDGNRASWVCWKAPITNVSLSTWTHQLLLKTDVTARFHHFPSRLELYFFISSWIRCVFMIENNTVLPESYSTYNGKNRSTLIVCEKIL